MRTVQAAPSTGHALRRRVVGGAVVALLALVAVAVLPGGADGHPEPLPARTPVTASLGAAPPTSVPPLAPPGGVGERPADRPIPPGWQAVCHGEPVPPEDRTVASGPRFARTRGVVTDLLLTLQVHPDPASRAAGIMMADSAAFADSFAETGRAAAACADPACIAGTWQRVYEGSRSAVEQRLAALVQLALSTPDIAVYALAAQACASAAQPPGACRQVSLAEWARREPDNMAPWLRLAQQATERQDPEARDQALFRASAGGRQDHHHRVVTAAALAALPDRTDAVVQNHLLGLALQVRDAKLLPSGDLAAGCTPALVRDANRWQRCDALAEALTRHGNSMIELRAGLRIGQSVGWSGDRLAGLREEADAMAQAHVQVLGDEAPLDCPALDVFRRFVADTGHRGELGTARAMLAGLGAPTAELARAQRARLAAVQARAQATAPGASAVAAGTD